MNNDELRERLTELSDGDTMAFEIIYKELSTPMYTIIIRIVQDRSLAEDTLQEVFFKLYMSPPTGIKNPRAYLFQMARNLAIDSVRKKTQFADWDDCENLIHLPIDDLPEKVDIENAMKALPLIECQIVSLHINGGLKFREIAEIMNTPLGTILWKYHKSINRLRSYLSGGAI